MSNAIQKVTDESFQNDVLASPVPVLVDYWCRVVRPVQD